MPTKGVKKAACASKKIRIGLLIGKDFDPVRKNTHSPDYPNKLLLTDDDWGKYSVDVETGLKMQSLHPDLLEIDFISGRQINEKRLMKNHVNLNFFYEVGVAMMKGGQRHVQEVTKCYRNPKCRVAPSWDFYDWILCKTRYMRQCEKAGIPIIPTIFYEAGFDADVALRDIQRRGWDQVFVKVGQWAFFGEGAIQGRTSDFLATRRAELDAYAEENRKSRVFLVQPYVLKPNGEVFDEVRNFFVDGEWRYSVFTHGTDESDAGYYPEPDGPRKEACRRLAERAYREASKASRWLGRRQTPLLVRVDVGVVPSRGGDSLHKPDNRYFLNEIEGSFCTWLPRYAPCLMQDVMAHAAVKHSLELVAGLLNANAPLPGRRGLKQAAQKLNSRLGPLKHVKIK